MINFDPLLSPVIWRGHDGFITDMSISQDGTTLVTGSVDKTVRLWDIAELNKTNISYVVLHGGTGKGIRFASMSNDGHYLASLDTDGSVRIWDILSPNPASVPIIINVPTEQTSIAVNSEKQWLLTSDPLAGVKIWGIQNLNILSKPLMGYGGGRGFALSHDGRWLVVHPLETCVPDQTGGSGPTPCYYNPPVLYDMEDPTAKEIVLSQDKTQYPSYSLSGYYPLAFSPDAHWLFTENDTTGYLWNLWSDNPIQESTILTRTPVNSVLFSSDGKWLATTDVGIFRYWASIQLWNMDDLSNMPIRLNCQNKDISSITFSPDSNYMVSGNADGEICIWSMKDLSAPPNKIDVSAGKVIALAMDPSNQWLVIGTTDGSVTKISMGLGSKKSVIFRDHVGAISSLFIDPLGKWIISTSDQDDAVRLRALSEDATTDLLDLACSVAGRNLTSMEWEHYLSDRNLHITCEEWPFDGNLSGWQKFWVKNSNLRILLIILTPGFFLVFPAIYLLFENDPDQKEVEEWMSHHFNNKLQIALFFIIAYAILWPHLIMYIGIKIKRLIKNNRANLDAL
jgi:WD40 repeat protein